MKTVAKLTVPFTFVQQGDYEITLDGQTAIVQLKYQNNIRNMGNVTGWEWSTSAGTMEMTPDRHGLANISRIVITFPFDIKPVKLTFANRTIDDYFIPTISTSARYLNRLIAVVRVLTRKYWIATLKESDLYINHLAIYDDAGDEEMAFLAAGPISWGARFPFPTIEETKVKDQISNILKNEQTIPIERLLFLDAMEYFSGGRYNESAIIANIVLEVVLATHIRNLIQKKLPTLEKREIGNMVSSMFKEGLHELFKKGFKEYDGRALEDDTELWDKFNRVRQLRKEAIHPHTRALKPEEAWETIQNVQLLNVWVFS